MRKALVTLIGLEACGGTSLAQNELREPLVTEASVLMPQGADPWVIFKDGFYYYTQTTGTDISIWKSRTIHGLPQAERHVIWRPPPSGPKSRNLWAPELHFLDGKWYIYYAADDGRNENHRMYVLEASHPLGPYRDKGKISDATDRWAIDGTVLEMGKGRRYFVWSGWESTYNGRQSLFIARMKNPWTIVGRRVRISTPTEPWEWEAGRGPKVNEAPQVLKRNGQVFIVYSADQSWTDNYKLGVLRLSGRNPMLSKNWEKLPTPLLQSDLNATRVAPGHCSFTTSPDGIDNWILFHTARFPGAGWKRHVQAQAFVWGDDDLPILDTGQESVAQLEKAVP